MIQARPRRQWRRWLAVMLGAGAIWFAAVQVWLPRQDPVSGAYDGVIVLSSGVRKDGRLDRNGEARLRRGVDVAVLNSASLYTTRVRRRKEPRLTSDSAQKHIVDSSHYSGQWKVTDGIALTTRDEAERFRRLRPAGRIVVVTTRLHTRRACATFEYIGFNVTCVSSGREAQWWLAPYFALYESAALVKYKLKGWI